MPLDIEALEPAVATRQRRAVGLLHALPVRYRQADRLTEFVGSVLHVLLLDSAGREAGACMV
jgi:hypothetical protein